MPNSVRNRYRTTDHFRVNTDLNRIRIQDISSGVFKFDRTRDLSTEQAYYSPDQQCIDTVGFYKRDNPLYLVNERSVPANIQFVAEHSYDATIGFPPVPNGDRQTNYRSYDGWANPSHILALDEQTMSDVEFVTKAVADLNPSRSNFQAAVFLAELRDLPSLFKNVGTELAEQGFVRGISGNYLKGQYGFRPLVNDLRTFFNIAGKLRNRMKTLDELRGKGKIRRQYRPPTNIGMETRFASMQGGFELPVRVHPYNNDTIILNVSTEMRTTRWCDVEFELDIPNNLFAPIDDERWDLAHSLVYGTTIDGPSIWAAMPWSWLIDWGTNASDYINSQNNVVGAKFSKAVLMKTTQRVSTVYPDWANPPDFNGEFHYTFSPGRLETVTKERLLGINPAAVSTTEPILHDGFRASIFNALVVQRFRPSHHINF